MLGKNIIKLAQTEGVALIVFEPTKDGTLQFCVDYCKLNAATNRDLDPIPGRYECIDPLDEATELYELDANSVY